MNKLTTLTLIALLLAPPAALHAAEPSKPSIIVVLTDDHGWADLGTQSVDAHIRTPNVDQLVRDGVRFSHGYVTAPQCTPFRAGLISGRYENKIGVEQNGEPMPGEVATLPERLKTSGYTTGISGISGISGKWHLDSSGRQNDEDGEKGKDPALAPHTPLEFPYKLIQFGRNKSLLFDITKPEGEHHSRELTAQQPEIAKRLRAKLDVWLATLKRPGPLSRHVREGRYTEAEILPGKAGITQP